MSSQARKAMLPDAFYLDELTLKTTGEMRKVLFDHWDQEHLRSDIMISVFSVILTILIAIIFFYPDLMAKEF